MAHRTSSRLLFTAFGVSLLAGAGQLGLAFGFGIVRLTGSFTGESVNQWPAQLVWAGWFAANAAVIGAVLTERVTRPGGQLGGTARQLAVAGCAAAGATIVAPLCMQPARNAELISVDPVWAVAICAGLGAVVGAGAALAVLVRPPFAWNIAAVAAVVWLLALLSVIPSLGASGPLTPVRLGVLEPAWLATGTAQQLALLILPLVCLLAGAATAAVARRRGLPPMISGPSGVAGPVLVAFAYLAAGPGDTSDRYQLTPYYAALIAVVVGALGSAAAALLPTTASDRVAPTGGTVIEPTAILQPLPATPALPASVADSADPTVTPPQPVVVVDDSTETDRSAGSPPHWHWPVALSDPSTATVASGADGAGPADAEATGVDDAENQPAAESDGHYGSAMEPATVGDGGDLPPAEPTTVAPAPPLTPAGRAPTPRRTQTSRAPDPSAAPPPATPPAQAAPAPTDGAEGRSAVEGVPETSPRPRQRLALPDLGGAPAGPVAPESPGIAAALPETPEVSIETAAAARDLTAAFTKPPAVRTEDVQPDGDAEKSRRGLFRRGRSRSAEQAADEQDEPLPAQDEEYVDWVTGLSRPLDDDDPSPPKEPRRSLRSTGRHHRH
ncbi:hypothetical protein HCA58_01290 [Micromonospora sp. HNM0581]|uniref:hypothetical protein n=1 Tax=Micromonospora sp. HNM0581 TaxID=2716341 RepID=UPI00146D7188|nr:hypothetical protein [Micromonospora sp. HNM0581]NLU77049.1 hypothetical protein [Micromonospora sp. HNM0581]